MKNTVVLGNFDGVHPGHAALLRKARDLREDGGRITAYTFQSLPGVPRVLTDSGEKRELLFRHGADTVWFERFDRVRDLPPERFVREVLRDALHADAVICGFNFRFGAGGTGDGALLSRLAAGYGIAAFVLSAVTAGGLPVSSTRIREALTAGRPEEARALLGRPYEVALPVLRGRQLGRTIGVPTANQRFPADRVVPAVGVYAAYARIGERTYPAVTNVGYRPTVDRDPESRVLTAETWIDGFSGDLYGKKLRIGFLSYLRGERQFDTLEELRGEIGRNREEALAVFRSAFEVL